MPHSRYEKRKHTMLPFFRFAGAGHIPTPLRPLGGEGEDAILGMKVLSALPALWHFHPQYPSGP